MKPTVPQFQQATVSWSQQLFQVSDEHLLSQDISKEIDTNQDIEF